MKHQWFSVSSYAKTVQGFDESMKAQSCLAILNLLVNHDPVLRFLGFKQGSNATPLIGMEWRVKREPEHPSGPSPVDRREGETFFVEGGIRVSFAPIIIMNSDDRRAALDPDFSDELIFDNEPQAWPWPEQLCGIGNRARHSVHSVHTPWSRPEL